MLSDIENLDIMLGENHFGTQEREGSLNSNLPRRSRSFASNESENEDGNGGRPKRNIDSRTNAECDRNSVTCDSSAEINRLSSELNSRISREMDEMMNSVSVQIQRAISDAISTQVLPQIQNVIMARPGHGTRKGWDALTERPELNSEAQRKLSAKSSLRNEQYENQLNNVYPEPNTHDIQFWRNRRVYILQRASFDSSSFKYSEETTEDVCVLFATLQLVPSFFIPSANHLLYGFSMFSSGELPSSCLKGFFLDFI